MRRFLLYALILATALSFVACEEVKLDERLVYVEMPEVCRAVLIEDYTGQYCVNCPRATQEIERLIEQYGDSVVIAVAIHSGPFAVQRGIPSPLYTEVGDLYFNTWGLESQPIGLVDRLYSSMPLNYTDWGAGVNVEVAVEAPVAFMTNSIYDSDTRQASIEVQTVGLDSALVSGKLQVWLVEDSIDSFQYMPDGSINEHYNHMHVFRASVNDPWGDELRVDYGEVVAKTYTLTLDPAWVPEHCSIVTFMFDENGVHQVAKTKLTF